MQPVNYIKRLAHAGCAHMPFVGIGVPLLLKSNLKCLNPPSFAALPKIDNRCVIYLTSYFFGTGVKNLNGPVIPRPSDYLIFALMYDLAFPTLPPRVPNSFLLSHSTF